MGLGWLRAVAQGFNYSYNNIEGWSKFQKNLRSWGVTLGWGLDGCARWRNVFVTVTIKWNWGSNFQNNFRRWLVNWGWGLDGCAR